MKVLLFRLKRSRPRRELTENLPGIEWRAAQEAIIKKMVEHIVLLKLKSGVTEAQLETLSDTLLGMAGEIPGIESITAGTNNSPEGKSQGYAYGFIVRFTDEAARDAYLPHPFHRQVASEHIRPLVEDVLVFDYSTP